MMDLFEKYIFIFVILSIDESESISNNCTCVPYYQCSEETDNLITDGSNLLDQRGYQSDTCNGYFDICCNTSLALIPDEPQHFTVSRKGCGYQQAYNFTWAGVLFHRDNSHKTYRCGISLINRQVAITAAHCFNSNSGDWFIKFGNITKNIKTIKIHPDYYVATLHNDIAVIIMETPLESNIPAGILCIPPPGTIYKNTKCSVSARKQKGSFTYLKIINIPIIPTNMCQKVMRTTRLGTHFQLDKSFLCAGGETFQDTCEGDGGNPLICPIPSQPGRYHQVGIVSWGIGCGENKTPSVYVNVAIFRDWIDNVLLENNIDINSYRY